MELLKKAPDPTDYDEEYIEEKPVAYDSRRGFLSTAANATPMKMLIAEEMSKDLDPNTKPPGVVARLMGLDPTPAHDLLSSRQRSNSEGYLFGDASRNHRYYGHLQIQGDSFTQVAEMTPWYPGNGLEEKCLPYSIQCRSSISEQQEGKEVHEVLQPSKVQKETYDGYLDEDKMDLVRQKFIEAKRLATDEKLRKSREFQEALEVLSSNRDLFLKCLQEPSYMFPGHLDKQPFQPRPQSKSITVLKPLKATAENYSWEQFNSDQRYPVPGSKNGQLGRKQQTMNQTLKKQQLTKAKELNEDRPFCNALFDNHSAFCFRPPGQADSTSHPTRIVVLKPSRWKAQDTRMVATFPPLSPEQKIRLSHLSSPEKFSDSAADEKEDSQGGDTSGQTFGSLNIPSIRALSTSDEPLLSSVFSNGYGLDESSFNVSESEDVEGGNLSDSEYMTPTSRHSWDLINRSSPYSLSSLSRASDSPESSVSREAKKRLSERWALSARGSHEERHARSLSTLGEMLAIPEINKKTNSDAEISEEGLSMPSSRNHSENNYHDSNGIYGEKVINDGVAKGSFTNLLRSRSVPVSSSAYNVVPLEGDAAKTEQHKTIAKAGKSKSASSLRRKVSSFFFPKNKKSTKDEREPSPSHTNCREGKSVDIEPSKDVSESQKLPVRINCGSGQYPVSISNRVCITAASTSALSELKGGCSIEAVLNQAEYTVPDILSENQEQPSPISVLDPPFDDEAPSPPGMDRSSSVRHASLSFKTGTSRISSPASLAATLSWEDPCLEDGISGDSRTEVDTVSLALVEEQGRFEFLQEVLTTAGLDEEQPDVSSFSHRWYSLNSPLDPSMLQSLSKWNNHVSNAKDAVKLRRAMMETKLLYDCINAVLLEMAGPVVDVNSWSRERSHSQKRVVLTGRRLLEEVWKRLQKIFSRGEIVPAVTAAESRGYVDKLLKKETGNRVWDWVELELVELDVIGREIENGVLENLLQEAISDFIHV